MPDRQLELFEVLLLRFGGDGAIMVWFIPLIISYGKDHKRLIPVIKGGPLRDDNQDFDSSLAPARPSFLRLACSV